MKPEEKQNKTKALVYSLVCYAGLIGICLLLGFSSPPPLPNQDMGMIINLGTSAEGTGIDQPLSPNPSAVQASQPHEAQASPASDETGDRTEEIMTQNTDDAPVIKELSEDKKEETFSKNLDENTPHTTEKPRPDAPVEPKPAPPKPKAIFSGGNTDNESSGNNAGASNSSEGEGLTGNPGDQGAVNGDPTASNHNGRFSGLGGNSLSYKLGGRRIVAYPSRTGNFSEAGKVEMRIKVNREGKITGYSIIRADNPTISELARKKIQEVKFNASSSAPVVQFGEIVFVFKIRQ